MSPGVTDSREAERSGQEARQTAAGLTCETRARLDVVSPEDWRRLFPDLPDSPEMIQLVQRSGIDGFAFRSIVVRHHGRPILLLPLFEVAYQLATFVEPGARPALSALARLLPGVFCPRVLAVGFVEGEWGQVGVDPCVERGVLKCAWDRALAALEALAAERRAALIAFVNFTTESGRMLPMHKLRGFAEMTGLPYGRVPVTFGSLERYIAGLSANTRSSVRRKIRKGQAISVQRTRQPGPWLETIYRYYRETVQHSDVVFGIHRRAYFEDVCEMVPGAEYWLYFLGERLLAFRLVVVRPDCLVDKYFGMDHVLGREYNLYFVSWCENIRYCIEQHIPRYHAGQAEEATKARLGAQLLPSLVLFKHRRPLLHRAFALIAKRFSYEPKVEMPTAHLGTDWEPAGLDGRLPVSDGAAWPSRIPVSERQPV